VAYAAGRICPAVVVPEGDAAGIVSGRHGSSAARSKLKKPERNWLTVVMIRLARIGARKQPYYRVVVIEKDRARNGRSIEVIGTYNPRTDPATVDLKMGRLDYWRSKGAQLSTTLVRLIANVPVPAPVEPAA
jgi:small subunit ribosomal protein S16